MKKIVLLTIAIMLPFMPCEGKPKKDGAGYDVAKNGLLPASENLKKTVDTNAPILAEGMKNFGSAFGQVFMQQLPQNIILSGAIVMGTVVVSKVTDAGIKHIEKSISGELAYEQIKNQKKKLETYRNLVNSYSNMPEDYKKTSIILKEIEVAHEDFLSCRSKYISDWNPLTRKRLYCRDGFPSECGAEFFKLIGSTGLPEENKEKLLSFYYQKS